MLHPWSWIVMVRYLQIIRISHMPLMSPKDSFLRHEATLVNEVSSSSSNPSPVHSELADVQKTHLPTQQDSMNRPKCDTMTNASLMAPATQRINCGGGYWFISQATRPFLGWSSTTFDMRLRKRHTPNHARCLLAVRLPQAGIRTRAGV